VARQQQRHHAARPKRRQQAQPHVTGLTGFPGTGTGSIVPPAARHPPATAGATWTGQPGTQPASRWPPATPAERQVASGAPPGRAPRRTDRRITRMVRAQADHHGPRSRRRRTRGGRGAGRVGTGVGCATAVGTGRCPPLCVGCGLGVPAWASAGLGVAGLGVAAWASGATLRPAAGSPPSRTCRRSCPPRCRHPRSCTQNPG